MNEYKFLTKMYFLTTAFDDKLLRCLNTASLSGLNSPLSTLSEVHLVYADLRHFFAFTFTLLLHF